MSGKSESDTSSDASSNDSSVKEINVDVLSVVIDPKTTDKIKTKSNKRFKSCNIC